MAGQKRMAGALAVAATAVAISACGSSDTDKTIDPAAAQTLQSALDDVQNAINNRRCNRAQARADDFVNTVNGLPDTVGTETKTTLREAGDHLVELAGDKSQCKPAPDTGASGETGVEPTTSSTTTAAPTQTTTTTSTTSTTTKPQGNQGGGNEGNGGGPPAGNGGGPPSNTGGGGGSGGGTGSGGTGSGGTG